MNLEITNNNKVYLSGTLASLPVFSHEIYGESFFEMNLNVSRLSHQLDVIPITISERLFGDLNFHVGQRIAVTGQFRSYNKMVEGHSKLMLTVFVREVLKPLDEDQNIIEIAGFVCKTPIYRTTPFKREICDVLLAVNRAYNKSDYLPCIAWGRNARFVKDLEIGQKVFMSGRIQSRQYQKKLDEQNTETRTAFEISISQISTEDNLKVLDENIPPKMFGEI